MRPVPLVLGTAVLGAVWIWPVPGLALPPFSAHMGVHMALVAVAAPLLAIGLAGSALDPVVRAPAYASAIAASMIELVVVWAWHTPTLHHAARHEPLAFAAEQATFAIAGLLLWTAAIGGSPPERRRRAIPGIAGLLFTSMHMTLLGALLTLANRPLFVHGHGSSMLSPEVDQQLGGAIMLLVGGAVYLAGGLGLVADLLRTPEAP